MSSPPKSETPPVVGSDLGGEFGNNSNTKYSGDDGKSKCQNGGPALRQAALAYAARGWRIFPLHNVRADGSCSCGKPDCKSVGKHPRTAHGQHDATADAAKIQEWWGKWPDANVGVYCEPSGICVVDIDPRNGGDETLMALEQEHGALTSCLMSDTGGGGKHIFFAAPSNGAKLSGKLGKGIDFKHNGYVVLPPSNHQSGKRYQWTIETAGATPPLLPAWIAAFGVSNVGERASEDGDIDLDFGEFSEAVFALPQELCDDYNEWIRVGFAIHYQTGGDERGYDLFDKWSQFSRKYRGSRETLWKWNSFKCGYRGVRRTARSVLKLARANGWRPWREVRVPIGYKNIDGEVALCVAALAIEGATYGERAAVRRHCLPVAMEVAKGHVEEQAARDLIGTAAASVGISAEEFGAMFDGALRFQRQEYALKQFLADEAAGLIVYATIEEMASIVQRGPQP